MMRVPNGVKLYHTSDLDPNFIIHSDPKRIQQILVNFISNSCKHTTEGEIHLHCAMSDKPGFIKFTVTDTGSGVSPEMAEVIFNRFASTHKTGADHGLGLDICRDPAKQLANRKKRG